MASNLRSAPDGTELVATRAGLMAALQDLPPRQRAVIVLRYYEDLTEAQAADVLGCSVGTVKSQSHRALTRLGRLHHPDFLRIAGQPRIDGQVPASWEPSFQTYSKVSGTSSPAPNSGWLVTAHARRRSPFGPRVARAVSHRDCGAADPVAARIVAASWQANGLTPNRSAVGVTAAAFDGEPFHAFAYFRSRDGKDRILHGGVVDEAVPVAVRLPDGQGWVTVSPGAQIQYWVADGSWSAAQENALLVPDGPGTDDVRVTRSGSVRLVGLG